MTNTPDPKGTRAGATRFAAFIARQEPSKGVLPAVHTTRAYSFDEMLGDDSLEPSDCPVFKEKLTYLFYGRPAYRAKDGNNARLQFEWPIIFIFDPTNIGLLLRVFPFDTGAFDIRLYKQFFDERSQLNDFSVEPSLDSIKKIVGAFYQDHGEYYSGNSHKNVEIPNRQFEAEGVLELSRLPGVQGERSFAAPRD